MLTIEIAADFVCPWCFIGTARLKAAVAMVRERKPDFSYRPIWRPFFLNPDAPPEGEPYLPFLEAKFGGRANVEAIFERVRAAGRPYGIDFAFEDISLRVNTLQAHRLATWAQQRSDAAALVARLYSANFQRGENLGDVATLVRIAGECGYDTADVSIFLDSDALKAEVLADEAAIRQRGITMVPTFLIGNQTIVGAEDPAILADAVLNALDSGC
jgi:predicted DsbA family dithiol-disulfide isomerase